MPSISKELDRILSVNNYDIRLRPYFGTDTPVDVKIGIDVADINAISEVDMDYQLDRAFKLVPMQSVAIKGNKRRKPIKDHIFSPDLERSKTCALLSQLFIEH